LVKVNIIKVKVVSMGAEQEGGIQGRLKAKLEAKILKPSTRSSQLCASSFPLPSHKVREIKLFPLHANTKPS
jgi:hypothetical protein